MQEQCTSVEELSTEGIAIYPVPADQFLMVRLKDHPGKTIISLSSVYGKLIKRKEVYAESKETNEHIFSVNDLPPGLYLVTIDNNSIHSSVKVIIE